MASGGGEEKEWRQVKDEITCSICGDLFTDPKTIPCFHTFFLQSPEQAVAEAEFCKTHIATKQALNLYCKTCSSLICQDCTLKNHPHEKHDFVFTEKVVDEEREKIKQVTAPLKQLLEQVRNAVKKIEHCDRQVDIESEANIKKVRATYYALYNLLKQQEEEIVGKVNTIKTSLKKTLAVQRESAKFVESQLVSCVEFSQRIVIVNRTRQLLTYNKWIENRVVDLTKQVEHTSLDPKYTASDMIVRCHNPVEFVSKSVCDVSCGLPDCTVNGPVVISDQIKVIMTVTLKDIFGSPVVNGSTDLEIRCNREGKFLQSTHIEEGSRGQYHIWYNVKRMEDHSLSLYWKGFEMKHEEIKVSMSICDYKQNSKVKIIDKYGPTNNQLTSPYLLAKGPNNELMVRDYLTSI
ncbi:E3 ubiquitin-protein ligase TRIM71-like [Dysidea avara]|uniref:E3 ubiquitin-protein ligase TRIM71-like n=1 Tax=Dysidea avara TaxID=196820 RepID=UPI003320E8AF